MSKKRILIVDDEADFVDVMKMRLEANDFEVITANNGEDGVKRARDDKPDAVLLDIQMPGMDGLEALKQIREFNKELPVFMVTAFSNDERFVAAKELKASGFIGKSSDLAQAVNNLTSVLNLADKYKSE